MGMSRAANIIILTMAILIFVSFFMFFYPGLAGAEKNNYLFLGIALLAPAIAAANYIIGRSKWFNLAIGLLCVLISALGAYKFKTGYLGRIVAGNHMLTGLRIIMSGYLVIGLCGLMNFVKVVFTKRGSS
jgi:hypothetical protein